MHPAMLHCTVVLTVGSREWYLIHLPQTEDFNDP